MTPATASEADLIATGPSTAPADTSQGSSDEPNQRQTPVGYEATRPK
jgi:hypothetical protein